LILHDNNVGNITSYLQANATFPSVNITLVQSILKSHN